MLKVVQVELSNVKHLSAEKVKLSSLIYFYFIVLLYQFGPLEEQGDVGKVPHLVTMRSRSGPLKVGEVLLTKLRLLWGHIVPSYLDTFLDINIYPIKVIID